MFTKSCEYAIRAVIFIAQQTYAGTKTGVKEIAINIGAPEHFIAKILQELVRKGLIQSAKGPNGGFYLDDNALHHSLADIVKAIDGEKLFYGCALGLRQCSESHPCPLHNEFKQVRNKLTKMLESATVSTFVHALENNQAFLKQ